MYYDLSNEAQLKNFTGKTVNFSLGPFYISTQQILIGVIVELFASIPSLLLVQLFRRTRSHQKPISSLQTALYKIKPNVEMFVQFFDEKSFFLKNIFSRFSRPNADEKKKKGLTLPWWSIFIAYGLCLILVGLSIIFTIARGIEFGDLKSQQWLTSILSGFFSSVLFTQPLKVKEIFSSIRCNSLWLQIIVLAAFFAFVCRKSNDDTDDKEYLDDTQYDLENDEEYLHSVQVSSFA